ncbi:protein canopy-1 [Osmerus eperlanus]|uniref:protein canopy-1 n=1 Tax=Osmerus eperlanus TaxID=29151 RepID=UPI002E14E7F2
MNMAPWIILMTLVTLSTICLPTTEGKKDEIVYCSACRAIVDELNFSISQVDPKKTIHVGSFRLNPDGSMVDKKVPLARSETHLSDLLEGVCGSMSDYALYEDPDTQEKQYRRFAPRDGNNADFPNFNNFKFDGPDGSTALKFACESIVEELEDDIITLFSQNSDHVVDKLCNRISDHCKDPKLKNEEL